MVELPRYVRAIKNGIGRRYFYFEKHRGTPQAWPRIPLPHDPLSAEFAGRIKQCESIELYDANGKRVLRFVDVMLRRHDLPDPADGEAFWRTIDHAEDVGRKLSGGERKTFSSLIVDYKDSDAYKITLSQGSRTEYDRYLDMIEAAWGGDQVALLTPVQAQKAIDSYKGTPAAARYFRSVLSRLIGWGIPRGYRHDNPIRDTEKVDSDGTYEPWPDWAFELWFQYARVGLHLPVYTALFTGQRSIDVYGMRRPGPKATEMPLVAQKTGELVPVQIHTEYRALINATMPADQVMILREEDLMLHLREDGEAWTLGGARTAWQREMTFEPDPDARRAGRDKAAAMKRLRDGRVVFHGLRKNAVIMLLEVGCTEKEVEKIVGMSPAMVEHYSKRVKARRLAISAMKKLETGWEEIRKSVLGNVARVG